MPVIVLKIPITNESMPPLTLNYYKLEHIS